MKRNCKARKAVRSMPMPWARASAMPAPLRASRASPSMPRGLLEDDALALPLEHERGAIMLRDVVGKRHDGLEEEFQAMIAGLALALRPRIEPRLGLTIAIGDGAVIVLGEPLDRKPQLLEFAIEVAGLRLELRLGLRRWRRRWRVSGGVALLEHV